ncbi:MAG TPA: ChbG/HpnK family deacetylase [Anaeromyxobacteraceae bacterium]|nr:ChbG/HpnK family deacetylase [Anaeromyxobacteraceae bacterium]
MKLLVVNADDLGYDPAIDRGILEAHRDGIVTSTSAMVDGPFAAASIRAAPGSLGVGLHAVIDPAAGEAAAEAELERQIALFEALRGAAPTHVDTHKHAHASPAVLAAVARVARGRRLPVRAIDASMRASLGAAGVTTADAFLGDAHLRPAWTAGALLVALGGIEDGVTELMAHPGHVASHARTSFSAEREIELAALCDPRAREAIRLAGIRLCTWADVGARARGGM